MTPEPSRASTVVIGIGNTMRHDDGVGIRAVEHLRLGGGPGGRVDLVDLDGESTRLIDAWRHRDRAVVVDAALTGGPPGAVYRFEVGRDRLPDWSAGASSHQAGLVEAVELARALDRLPDRLVLLGMEAADLSPGEGLSPEVHAALPGLIDQIRAEVAD